MCVCVCVFAYAHLCPALYNAMDCGPSGSSVHEIFQEEYWSGLPFPSLGYLPDLGIETSSPVSCIAGWILSYCATKETQKWMTQT